MPKTEEQLLIYKRIDEILWFDWDPIGINDYEEARDEYQSYLYEVFSLKINGSDKDTIASCLHKIETGHIGLSGNMGHCRKIAEKIFNI